MSTDQLLPADSSSSSSSSSSAKTVRRVSLTARVIRELELTTEVAETQAAKENKDTADEADDAASIASDTSTDIYEGHESYSTYQHKVAELCRAAFPHKVLHTFELEHIEGGSYNRIVGLTIAVPRTQKFTMKWMCERFQNMCGAVKSKEPEKYIIRIPRFEAEYVPMEYDIAVLRFAGARLELPIPRLVCADTSTENAIQGQYMIQQRLPGENLARMHMQTPLTPAQQLCLTRQMVDILSKIHNITNNSAGIIDPSTVTPKMPTISTFAVPSNNLIPDKKPRTGLAKQQTTLEFILELCDRRIELDLERNSSGFVFPSWIAYKQIAQTLHSLGFIPDSDTFHLCHFDLLARNTLVSVPDHDTLNITGLLDWDAEYICFVPKFVAYRAPYWLRVDDDNNEEDEDFANKAPEKPENVAAKKLFEELAGEEWLRYAYAPEYVLARKMFAMLKNGYCCNEDFVTAENVVKEWHKLHPETEFDSIWEDDFVEDGDEDEEDAEL